MNVLQREQWVCINSIENDIKRMDGARIQWATVHSTLARLKIITRLKNDIKRMDGRIQWATVHSTLARLKIISLYIDYTLLPVVLTHLNSRLVVLQSVQVRNNFTFAHFNNGMYGHTPIMLFISYFLDISDFRICGTTRACGNNRKISRNSNKSAPCVCSICVESF